MVRFFLSSLFPTVDKLLYLDNDVIVTCCLEEVWNTKMTSKQIVGKLLFTIYDFILFHFVLFKINFIVIMKL